MSLCCLLTCSSREGKLLLKWLPVDCESSAAINQVTDNISQIKFGCNTLGVRRVLALRDKPWQSGLSLIKKKSFNPPSKRRECVHPPGRATAEEPDGWRRSHSAFAHPGEPTSRASSEHWDPVRPVMGHNELLKIWRSSAARGALSARGWGGFIYLIWFDFFFVMFWIEGREVNTAELWCISFSFSCWCTCGCILKTMVELKVCTATKRVKITIR